MRVKTANKKKKIHDIRRERQREVDRLLIKQSRQNGILGLLLQAEPLLKVPSKTK